MWEKRIWGRGGEGASACATRHGRNSPTFTASKLFCIKSWKITFVRHFQAIYFLPISDFPTERQPCRYNSVLSLFPSPFPPSSSLLRVPPQRILLLLFPLRLFLFLPSLLRYWKRQGRRERFFLRGGAVVGSRVRTYIPICTTPTCMKIWGWVAAEKPPFFRLICEGKWLSAEMKDLISLEDKTRTDFVQGPAALTKSQKLRK